MIHLPLRLVMAPVGILVFGLGWSSSAIGTAPCAGESATAYTYDAPYLPAECAHANYDRGPPVSLAASTFDPADSRSHGARARQDVGSTTFSWTYDTTGPLGQLARATTTTQSGAVRVSGESSAPQRWGIATKTETKVPN